jgi:predicted permease
MEIRQVLGNWRIYLICFLRLLFLPAIILLMILELHMKDWIPSGNEILLVVFLAVITPAASSITQFAQLYEKDAEYAGAINILTTLLCIVTMPCLVAVYQWI